MWQQMMVVGLGGALGSMLRFGVYHLANLAQGRYFVLPTLAINVIGSFFIGIAYFTLVERLQLPPIWRTGLMVGFLGGFTTFSTFSLDALRLMQSGEWPQAILYMLSSVVLCLLATLAGYALVEKLFA